MEEKTRTLRPAQEEILKYEDGRLAISAVPGSGKTFTLVELAVQVLVSGEIRPCYHTDFEQIFIDKYKNTW